MYFAHRFLFGQSLFLFVQRFRFHNHFFQLERRITIQMIFRRAECGFVMLLQNIFFIQSHKSGHFPQFVERRTTPTRCDIQQLKKKSNNTFKDIEKNQTASLTLFIISANCLSIPGGILKGLKNSWRTSETPVWEWISKGLSPAIIS